MKHKVFISYYHDEDQCYKNEIEENFGHLFISKSVVGNNKLTWPKKMIRYGAMELDKPLDILENLPSDIKMPELFQ